MSQNFSDKDYGGYFESLEKQLNKPIPSRREISKQTPLDKKRGVYKVIRLRKSVVAVCLALVLILWAVFIVTNKKPIAKPTPQQTETEEGNEPKYKYVPILFANQTTAIPSTNDAQSAIIVNLKQNKVIAERQADKRMFPASTTKIMTLLVAAENIKDMNDTFTMTLDITDPLYIAEASVAGFLNGEKVNMKDLLYGCILPSGADAAMGLAIKVAGSEEAFVKLMNKKVKELGLENTNFTNVTGLHNEQNYSSAYDMASILKAALENEICREVLSTYRYTTAKTPQNPNGIDLSSTLFDYMYGTEPETATILGGKTGFVNESGYCIASYGKAIESGNEYIVVTLSNSSKWPAFHGQIDLYKQFAK